MSDENLVPVLKRLASAGYREFLKSLSDEWLMLPLGEAARGKDKSHEAVAARVTASASLDIGLDHKI